MVADEKNRKSAPGGEDPGIREILIRVPNWVGDNIFCVPAVQEARRRFPAARITVLAAGGVADFWGLAVEVDRVLPFRLRSGWRDLGGKRKLIREIRRRKFDLAVIFPRSFEAALWLRLAGVPRRWGYAAAGRSFLLTRPASSTRGYRRTPRIDYYYHLFAPGEDAAPPARLVIPPGPEARARELLRREGIDPADRTLVGFHPRSSYGPAKCWPPDNFSRLAGLLAARKNALILLFGSEGEKGLLEEIAAGAGEAAVNLAGRTDLPTLAALMVHCRVVVANDSGPLHLAAALGVPVVGLYGSTDPAATGPRGEKVRTIYKAVPCAPCLKRVCPGDLACLISIKPEEVLSEVERVWEPARG